MVHSFVKSCLPTPLYKQRESIIFCILKLDYFCPWKTYKNLSLLVIINFHKYIPLPQADVDGDGALNYGEFVAVSVHLRRMANDEHLHKAFAYFDQNRSGYIEI